jgi:hypothetical protein
VALVERVQLAAELGARETLQDLAATLPVPIACIAIRACPTLPRSIEARIADSRAANVADSAMYRQAFASAADARGLAVYWYDREHVFHLAETAIGSKDLSAFLCAMGLSIGPPWHAKRKLAAAAAIAARMET